MIPRHKYLGRIWFVRDITERETLQEALRSSEVKFRNLVESTSDFIWEIDESGRYTYVSPAAKALFGYEPVELIGKSPFDFMSGAEAARVAAEFATIARDRRAFSQLENTVTRTDGAEVALETSGVPIFDKGGNFRGYRGIDRDVTPRKRAALALLQRDALLHVVAISSAEFVTSPSVDEVIPKVLEIVGNTIRIDRVTVLENRQSAAEPPMLRYVWQSADVTVSIDPGSFENRSRPSPEVLAWQAPLQQGKVVLTDARSTAGDVRSLLEGLGTRTILVVPILIDGKYWGQVGFESCKSERLWQDFEVEILRTLAELIGSAIQRERYVKEIADANQIIQNTPTILYRLAGNPSLPVTYVSHNIKLFGYDPAALTVSPQFLMNIVHPDDTAKVRDALAAALDDKSRPAVIEYRMLTSGGAYRWIENRYTPIRNAAGRLVEIEGILIDVTERKAAEEKIAHLARTDALTGLANRATFIERLRHAFAAARRGSPAFAVLYLDIDRFKDINDTLGHPLGDLLLNMVGERLRSCVRETDLVARLGGDEFAVLQAGLSDTADAGALATKICTTLAAPIRLDGNQLHITASVGISTYASDIAGPDDMLSQADLALYRAKDEGRDQYRFHSEDLDHEVRERVALADELRGALERDELELYYQPQVELGTGQIVGMEALIRWNHPTRGPLKPTAFLPIAEKTGTIMAIGQWVLDRSCRQMRPLAQGRNRPAHARCERVPRST